MTLLDASDDKQQLDKIIHNLPKYAEEHVMELYKNGKIKDCAPFLITKNNEHTYIVTEQGDAKGEHWRAGIFIKGKMPFVDYDLGIHGAKRLEHLKRSAVAHLMHIAETKWIPLARSASMPQRWQHVESGKILYSKSSVEKELEDAKNDSMQVQEDFMPEVKEIEVKAPLE